MAFGFSVGDFVMLAQLALQVYRNCKQAGDEYDEIAFGVNCLRSALRTLRKESRNADSIIFRLDSVSTDQLGATIDGCENVLKSIEALLEKYNGLGAGSLSGTTRKWLHRIGFGSKVAELNVIRGKLGTYNSAMLVHIETIQLRASRKLEKAVEGGFDDVKMELGALKNAIHTKVSSKRAAERMGAANSLLSLSTYAGDEKNVWREFRRELIEDGIKSDDLKLHKKALQAFMSELSQKGLANNQKKISTASSNAGAMSTGQHCLAIPRSTQIRKPIKQPVLTDSPPTGPKRKTQRPASISSSSKPESPKTLASLSSPQEMQELKGLHQVSGISAVSPNSRDKRRFCKDHTTKEQKAHNELGARRKAAMARLAAEAESVIVDEPAEGGPDDTQDVYLTDSIDDKKPDFNFSDGEEPRKKFSGRTRRSTEDSLISIETVISLISFDTTLEGGTNNEETQGYLTTDNFPSRNRAYDNLKSQNILLSEEEVSKSSSPEDQKIHNTLRTICNESTEENSTRHSLSRVLSVDGISAIEKLEDTIADNTYIPQNDVAHTDGKQSVGNSPLIKTFRAESNETSEDDVAQEPSIESKSESKIIIRQCDRAFLDVNAEDETKALAMIKFQASHVLFTRRLFADEQNLLGWPARTSSQENFLGSRSEDDPLEGISLYIDAFGELPHQLLDRVRSQWKERLGSHIDITKSRSSGFPPVTYNTGLYYEPIAANPNLGQRQSFPLQSLRLWDSGPPKDFLVYALKNERFRRFPIIYGCTQNATVCNAIPYYSGWTIIARKLVSEEAVENGKENYEVVNDRVVVFRGLSIQAIYRYMKMTKAIETAKKRGLWDQIRSPELVARDQLLDTVSQLRFYL